MDEVIARLDDATKFVRGFLTALLALENDIAVVAEARDGDEASRPCARNARTFS